MIVGIMPADLETFYSALSEAAAGMAAILAAVLVGRLQQQLSTVKRLVDEIRYRYDELRAELRRNAADVHDFRIWAESVRPALFTAVEDERWVTLPSERWLSGGVDGESRIHVTQEYVDDFRVRESWLNPIEDALRKVFASTTVYDTVSAVALLKSAQAQFSLMRRDRQFLAGTISASDRIANLSHYIRREAEVLWSALGIVITIMVAFVVIAALGCLRSDSTGNGLLLTFGVAIVALAVVLAAEAAAVKKAARYDQVVDTNA